MTPLVLLIIAVAIFALIIVPSLPWPESLRRLTQVSFFCLVAPLVFWDQGWLNLADTVLAEILVLVSSLWVLFVLFLSRPQPMAKPMSRSERGRRYDTSRVIEPRRRNTMDLGKPE